MKHLLRSKKLWGYVAGTTKLSDPPGEGEKDKFEEKFQDAVTLIMLAMMTKIATLVETYKDPIKLWK